MLNCIHDFKIGRQVIAINHKENLYVKECAIRKHIRYTIKGVDSSCADFPCKDIYGNKCTGAPLIVDDSGSERSLCGYGAPWKNFRVVDDNWDI